MSTTGREEKLERAVRAALRLRRSLYNILGGQPKIRPKSLLCPMDEVDKFDAVIKELSDGSQ